MAHLHKSSLEKMHFEHHVEHLLHNEEEALMIRSATAGEGQLKLAIPFFLATHGHYFSIFMSFCATIFRFCDCTEVAQQLQADRTLDLASFQGSPCFVVSSFSGGFVESPGGIVIDLCLSCRPLDSKLYSLF